ncbi:MAG: DDE-type integrase/transposase/recombinase, partial [Candidatus Thiodiazotropha sp.]
ACLTQACEDNEGILPNIKNEKPIYYLSHKLSKTQCKWSTIEKEAFAIHYSLQKLDYYLHNARFVIKTDHKPLKYILESPIQNKKISLWALGMSGYNCSVEYIAGTENTCADLLSRKPDNGYIEQENEPFVLDINDNTYEIGVINSHEIDPKTLASCKIPEKESFAVPDTEFTDIDMVSEQTKDREILELKTILKHGEPSKAISRRYIIENDLLYYLSDPNDNPTLRLFVPEQLRHMVIKQYHDDNGHMGVQKTYDSIRQKYFWPNLFQELYEYVSACVPCQTRSKQTTKPLLQKPELPPYPFAKLSLDLSGPYPKTLSGNKYIIAFVDWYSGWAEAFPVPDKTADNVAHLILNEIFPRFGCPLEIVSDNGSENVNRVVKETLDTLNIHHVTTSFYNPKANSKVERFHRTLHDIMAKRLTEGQDVWDLHLNQVLAAYRFNVSEATGYSPYFLLYGRDVVLPIDNLLRPRLKYHGEDMHQISLQEQHKAFMLVHGRLRKQQRKQDKYANKNRKDISYKVGDPVYWQKHKRQGKIDKNYHPYYRIIEQKSPVTYVIRNQLDGTTEKVHADHLKLAKIDQWTIPKTATGQPIRKAAYVVPPPSDDSLSESSESEPENPQEKLIKYARNEREDSGDEDDIPLMELAARLRARKRRENETSESGNHESEDNAYASEDMHSLSGSDSEATVDYDYMDSMMVVQVHNCLQKKETPEAVRARKLKRTCKDKSKQFRTLFNAIAEFF